MKERKQYEIPGVTVINMRANSDIIQTSGEEVIINKLYSGTSAPSASATKAVNANSDISGLFQNN